MALQEQTDSPNAQPWQSRLLMTIAAALAVLAVLIAYPVMEMGVSDDSSYYRTALLLAQTGHFTYNGWSTAMLGVQMYYGALWIKLLGFSFTALRLAMLPVSAGCAIFLYKIAERAKLPGGSALLVTLTLVLSPVYLPLAASFMTDVTGLFFYLVGLYACLRAIETNAERPALLWLAGAVVASVLGCTVRQPDALIALVGVPLVLIWRRRFPDQGRFTAIGALLLLVGTVGIVETDRWFEHQPYALHASAGDMVHSVVPHGLHDLLVTVRESVHKFFSGAFTGAALVLPVTLLTLPTIWMRTTATWPGRKGTALRYGLPIGLALLLLPVGLFIGKSTFWPYWEDVFSYRDFWHAIDYLGESGSAGDAILPGPIRLLLLIAVCATTAYAFLLFAIGMKAVLRRPGRFVADWSGRGEAGTVPPVIVFLSLLSIVYLFLVWLRWRMPGGILIDRYWVPVMPALTILALHLYHRTVRPQVPRGAWALLSLFALYSVLSLHDHFAIGRARIAAANRLMQTGVPRTAMYVSFPYDAWTQLEQQGHLNDWRITNPPDAYHPEVRHAAIPQEFCWYDRWMPALAPHWVIVLHPSPAFANSQYAPMPIPTWLPPYDRHVYTQMVHEPGGARGNLTRAANPPRA